MGLRVGKAGVDAFPAGSQRILVEADGTTWWVGPGVDRLNQGSLEQILEASLGRLDDRESGKEGR
jgi:hypothetical protein